MAKLTISECRRTLFDRKNQDEEISLKVEISSGSFVKFNGSVREVRAFLFMIESNSDRLTDSLTVII